MSRAPGARGIVLAHGAMAEGLVDAVRRIAGDAGNGLVPLSNSGKSPETLQAELDELAGPEPVVVFTDLPAGSCGMAGAQSCRHRSGRVLICGVNLPMLLEFVFHREEPLDDLVVRLVEGGRGAIRSTRATG